MTTLHICDVCKKDNPKEKMLYILFHKKKRGMNGNSYRYKSVKNTDICFSCFERVFNKKVER